MSAPIEGVAAIEIAGNGYLNVRLDRGYYGAKLLEGAQEEPVRSAGKIIVEHTNINPNKAAHIGHLRNAILGDTFVRMLRSTGRTVEVQNYIDNTGVQVADVVAGSCIRKIFPPTRGHRTLRLFVLGPLRGAFRRITKITQRRWSGAGTRCTPSNRATDARPKKRTKCPTASCTRIWLPCGA